MSTYSGLEFANSEHLSHWACEVKHSQGDENAGGTETAQLMTCTAKTTTRVQLAWPMVRPTHEDWSDRPRAAVCDHTSADSSPLFFVSDYRLISCRTSALYTTWKIVHPSFPTIKMVGGGRILYTWNFGPNWPCWSENSDFQ